MGYIDNLYLGQSLVLLQNVEEVPLSVFCGSHGSIISPSSLNFLKVYVYVWMFMCMCVCVLICCMRLRKYKTMLLLGALSDNLVIFFSLISQKITASILSYFLLLRSNTMTNTSILWEGCGLLQLLVSHLRLSVRAVRTITLLGKEYRGNIPWTRLLSYRS